MSKWLLMVGVVLGLVTGVLLHVHIKDIRERQEKLGFLRLQPDAGLRAGEVLSRDKLKIEFLPEGFKPLTEIAVPADDNSVEWVVGRRVTEDVPKGSFLLHRHFVDEPERRFAALVAKGKRAITIPVGAPSAVGFFVQPGSSVDILGTFVEPERPAAAQPGAAVPVPQPGGERRTYTRVILQNVRVLAVGQATTRGSYLEIGQRGYSHATIEVTPLQAETLVFAMQQARGELTLALRNPADDQTVTTKSVDWETLR